MAMCYHCMRGEIVRGRCNFCGRTCVTAPTSDQSIVLSAGTQLQGGAVTVGTLLGKGGFGATYVAHSAQDGVIALKEYLPGSLIEPERIGNRVVVAAGRERRFEDNKIAFAKEAELLSRLSHPNIVRVKMLFEENNTVYYAMDLLEGSDLQTFIRARKDIRLSAKAAANLIECMDPVLDALAYLHRRQIFHRDISPSNIYLCGWNLKKNSLAFSPCLIDFGAAYADHTAYHKSLARVKNPHYSPFEQGMAQQKITPAYDIYSFCATLYHLLTGVAPQAAIDRMTGEDELAPPGAINPALRPLDQVLMRGMALRAENRIQRVEEVRQALAEAVVTLRGGKRVGREANGGGKARSVLALAFDAALPISLALPFTLQGNMPWELTSLAFLLMFFFCALLLLAADATLGMLIFRLPKRRSSFGRKMLTALLRSALPYAVVDMILYLCDVYPEPRCNGRPLTQAAKSADFVLTGNYLRTDGRRVEFVLPEGKIVRIGRKEENDIVVPADRRGVSGLHAEVLRRGETVYLRDLSSNGCCFRGQRLRKGETYAWPLGEWLVLPENVAYRLEKGSAK